MRRQLTLFISQLETLGKTKALKCVRVTHQHHIPARDHRLQLTPCRLATVSSEKRCLLVGSIENFQFLQVAILGPQQIQQLKVELDFCAQRLRYEIQTNLRIHVASDEALTLREDTTTTRMAGNHLVVQLKRTVRTKRIRVEVQG